MTIILREYQEDIVTRTREAMRQGHRSILIVAPTGSGKTALTSHMINVAAQKGMQSYFIVHRRELVLQSVRAFFKNQVPHGIISSGFPMDDRQLVQIASVQTLANRLGKIRRPSFMIWDEAHHLMASSWEKIFLTFPETFHIGLTATPIRLDGAGLGKHFHHMIEGPTTRWLIDQGYLSPFKYFAPSAPNLDGVHTRMGDFVISEMAAALDKPSITGSAIKEYQKKLAGKRAVVFGVSIEHSEHIVHQFKAAGINALHVDGETNSSIRDNAVKSLQQNEIQILSNVDLFGEGFDLPAIDGGFLLRPTQSLALFLQQCGRVLRPIYADGFDLSCAESRKAAIAAGPKPFAYLFDHAGNWERHGLPDDEREWTLQGFDKKKKKDNGAGIKLCPACFAANHAYRSHCESCGLKFIAQARQVEQVEGDLKEIDTEAIRTQKKEENKKAQTEAELVALGKARNYKRPELWARHLLIARGKKKRWGNG